MVSRDCHHNIPCNFRLAPATASDQEGLAVFKPIAQGGGVASTVECVTTQTRADVNILHAISNLDPATGGPARALLGLALAQAEFGHRVTVLESHPPLADRSLSETLVNSGIRVRSVPSLVARGRWFPGLRATAEAAVESSDLVHAHGVWTPVVHEAARAALDSSTPLIVRPCGMLDPWSLRQSALRKKVYLALRMRRILSAASALHFTTPTEHALTAPLRLPTPAIIEPNGIDLREFQVLPPEGRFRKTLGLRPDQRIVLFLGRLHPKKGLDILIPAFAQSATDSVLVIAGPSDSAYRGTLKNLISQLGVDSDRIRFVGMLHGEDRVAALADADLFALTSHQENFGIAVAEALAAGTPVLISDQVNLHDEVSKGQVGAVVPLKVDLIRDALDNWLQDDDLRQSAAHRARPFVAQRFDWRRLAQRWHEHYERLIVTHRSDS